jgi:hypothetical protein
MMLCKNRFTALIGLGALIVIALSVVGEFIYYSPVPYWDMWNGYLDFFVQSRTSDWHLWWQPHNEHRIVLARLLFWADLTLFKGSLWFLIIWNYIFTATSCLLFCLYLKSANLHPQNRSVLYIGTMVMSAWLFSWCQQENLTWGFQSQFFLAQLMPLAALYLLYRSTLPTTGNTVWLGALIVGVLCVGTMANGILALPLMVIYSALLRQPKMRTMTLAAAAVVTIFLYLHGTVRPENHASLTQSLLHNPLGITQYVLRYIGGPFYYMLGSTPNALLVSHIVTVLMIATSAVTACFIIRKPTAYPLQLALLLFIAYIGATALGTAGGRLNFGLDQAFSSRYMTPALMAWAAFFVLMLSLRYSPNKNITAAVGFKAFAALMVLLILPYQFNALTSRKTENFEREISALALEMRIQDQAQISKVFPWAEAALRITAAPIREELSIFSDPRLVAVKDAIGTTMGQLRSPACLGHLDSVTPVDQAHGYVKVAGWLFDPTQREAPEQAFLINADNVVVGYVLTGAARADVAALVDKRAGQSGFAGYLKREQLGSNIRVQGASPTCQASFTVPKLLFTATVQPPSALAVSVSEAALATSQGWRGMDSWKSSISGMKVIGSWVAADSDVGATELSLKKGDTLYYRSGPTGGRQMLGIPESGQPESVLPVAEEWTLLKFDDNSLPEHFTVRITDTGDGWGEWSAIAVKASN